MPQMTQRMEATIIISHEHQRSWWHFCVYLYCRGTIAGVYSLVPLYW